jgi:hypothetical protein
LITERRLQQYALVRLRSRQPAFRLGSQGKGRQTLQLLEVPMQIVKGNQEIGIGAILRIGDSLSILLSQTF